MSTAGEHRGTGRVAPAVAGAIAALALGFALSGAGADPPARPLPELLSATGLFPPGRPDEIDPRALPYVPQYPLWTDGATKRRWVYVPDGAAIDARDPDAWQFPAGTRFWKEFSFGRRVETRYIERLADGGYRFATYLWSEDGRDARLVPPERTQRVPVAGNALHEVPSESDCRACHEGRRTPILGFGALQLSPDRDPLAPHAEALPEDAVDLRALAARGVLGGLSERLLRHPPRIQGRTARERAALGYLFGNCSGCHNAEGPVASVGLDFDQRLSGDTIPRALHSAVGRRSRFAIPGATETLRIAPGRPDASAVVHRMGSRFAATQMPPLGTLRVDDDALALVRQWIANDLGEVEQGKDSQP